MKVDNCPPPKNFAPISAAKDSIPRTEAKEKTFKELWLEKKYALERVDDLNIQLAAWEETHESAQAVDYSKIPWTRNAKDTSLEFVIVKDELIAEIQQLNLCIRALKDRMISMINARIMCPTYRQVARLYYVDGMPLAQIAEHVHYCRATVYRAKNISNGILGLGGKE